MLQNQVEQLQRALNTTQAEMQMDLQQPSTTRLTTIKPVAPHTPSATTTNLPLFRVPSKKRSSLVISRRNRYIKHKQKSMHTFIQQHKLDCAVFAELQASCVPWTTNHQGLKHQLHAEPDLFEIDNFHTLPNDLTVFTGEHQQIEIVHDQPFGTKII
jgi:hypothetical protein